MRSLVNTLPLAPHEKQKLSIIIQAPYGNNSSGGGRRLSGDAAGSSAKYGVRNIPDALTVLDAVTIDNALVFNTVIDQCDADRLIIVKDEAAHLKFFDQKARVFKDNIKAAVTYSGVTIKYNRGNQAYEQNYYGYRKVTNLSL